MPKDKVPKDKADKVEDGRWMTAERYRRIGKYMKPWGKPPTGVTFWVQLLTTAAVIIISIFKGVDSSVEMVISYGVPEYHQQQSPQNLAFGIIFMLTCFVVLTGYLWLWFVEWRIKRQEAAALAESAELAEAAAAKAPKAKADEADTADDSEEPATRDHARHSEEAAKHR